MAFLLFSSFAIFLVFQMPVSFALAMSSMTALGFASDISLISIIQRMYTSSSSFTLVAIPFFILAGGFMENGGISRRLVKFASCMVGHIRGGLTFASILGAMFFAGISGAAAADTAAVGSILIPAMIKKGYGKDVATSVMATAGSIGIIIPPSIPMILLGVTANISIGALFAGGILPGILMGVALMVTSYIFAVVRKLEPEPRASLKEIWNAFKDAILAIMTMVIIVGGIVGGIFTPSEASVVAAIYAFIVGMFIYKELKMKDLPKILLSTATTTGVVVLCIAAASSFGWILTAESIPAKISEFIFGVSTNKWIILFLVNGLMLFMGTFLDITPIIIIVIPIVFPIIMKLGIHPIHFGLMTIVNMAIGQCTPPVGITLFVSTGISEASLGEVLGTYLKYILTMIIVLTLITFIPAITTFLPRVLGYIK